MVPSKVSDDFSVFISYAHSDNENSDPSKRWLDRLLEHLGVIQNRISFWSDTDIEIGEQWDKSIKRQLWNAKVAVLLISPAFLSSKYIRNSELPVLLMNAKEKGTTVLPVILRHSLFAETTFKYPDPVQGPNELSLAVFQTANPPENPLNSMQENQQDKVLDSVARRILKLVGTKNTIGPAASGQPVFTVPFGRNRFFTGRAQVLDDLRRELTAEGKAALSGLGGTGKTQTAAQYAHLHRDEYKAVLWAKAESQESLNSDFGALAVKLNLPLHDDTNRYEAVKEWLERQSGWLLVLDNADDLQVVSDFLRREWPGHILLTTRSNATGSIGQVELKVMGSDEGALFLLRRAKLIAVRETLQAATTVDRELAAEITRELGGLPLALDQAGAFIERMPSSLKEYLKLYRREGDELRRADRSGYFADHDHDPVRKTFSLAYGNVAKASAAAADLLRVCAFLAPDAIPEEIFVAGASEMGETLRPMTGGGLYLVEVIGEAGRFSLIRRDAKCGNIEIHRLVQQVLRDEMSAEEQRVWAERVIRGLNATFPEVEHKNWPLCEKLLPHALEGARLIKTYDLAFIESARLLNEAGNYCFERAQYAEAEPLFKLTLTIRERVLGLENAEVAMSLNNLAAIYDHQGRYAEAEPLFKRALGIRERVLGPDHLDVALILNNFAAFYDSQQRYAEAERLYERSLAIRERALHPFHPGVATSLNNLGSLYNHQGRYSEAEKLIDRSLKIREQALGPDDPDVARSLNSLAATYIHQGRYPEAKPLLERSLAIRERALRLDHPDLARTLNNLAAVYESQGKYSEAKALLERSLDISQKALGPNHPKIGPIRKQYTELLKRSGY